MDMVEQVSGGTVEIEDLRKKRRWIPAFAGMTMASRNDS
jgi:hypothetical protein